MNTKKTMESSSSITGITIHLTAKNGLETNILTCKYSSPTITDQDPLSEIEEHIEKYSGAWKKLAKK